MGCVAGVLLYNGTMPAWLGVLVISRDGLLVGGAFAARAAAFGWRWPGAAAFFRTADVAQAPTAVPPAAGAPGTASAAAASGPGGGSGGGGGVGTGGVGYMRPMLISKANTVLQLLLVSGRG